MNISLESIDNAPFSYKDVKKIVFFDNSWYILADNKLWQTNDAKNWKDLNLRIESSGIQSEVFSVSNDALIIASNEGRGKMNFYIKRKGHPNFVLLTLNINQGVEIAGAMYFKDRVYLFLNFSVKRVHEKEGLIFNSKETYYTDALTIYSSSLYGGDLKEEEKWWSSAESGTITIINNRPILVSKCKSWDAIDDTERESYFFNYLTKENGWKRSDTGIKGGYSSEHKLMLVNNGVYYFKGSNFGGGNLLYFSDDGKYWDLVGEFNSYGENAIETFNFRETCLFSLGCGDEICYFSKNDSRRYPYKLCYGNSKVKPENYQSVEIKVLPNCLAFNEQGVGLLSTSTEDEEGIYLLKITK